MIRLFRLAIVQGHHNGAILRLLVSVCLLGCLQSRPAFACRYNVREVGFVDLHIEPYYLFGYVNDETGTDFVSKFKQIAGVGLENSNIEFEIINIDQQKNHPAMKYIDLRQAKSLPAAVLVSPDGQSYPVSLAERDRPFEETLRSAVEDILSSPKRKEILQQVIETYGVVLLIEGADDQENKKAKEAVSGAIEQISTQMDMLPKPIAHPPVLIVIDSKSLRREKILLWSLGLDVDKASTPHAAIVYGRARWIGPLFKGEEIDENNLAGILFVIGADCECGLDHRWLQGTMLPARWDEKMQARVAENLGFDPENPMVKMEMSMIIRRGSYSYPGVPLGYQEIVIEPNSAMEGRQSARTPQENSPNQVEDIAMPESNPSVLALPPLPSATADKGMRAVKPISESYPLGPSVRWDQEGHSTFRNTIFVLVGLCALVLVSGIAILVRAKRR